MAADPETGGDAVELARPAPSPIEGEGRGRGGRLEMSLEHGRSQQAPHVPPPENPPPARGRVPTSSASGQPPDRESELSDEDPLETAEWLDALEGVVRTQGREQTRYLIRRLLAGADRLGVEPDAWPSTPYLNRADVWSVTSYSELRRDGLAEERWNRLHPDRPRQPSYVAQTQQCHCWAYTKYLYD